MTFWAMLGFAAVLIGALFLANNLQPRQSAASSVRDRGGMERGFGTGLCTTPRLGRCARTQLECPIPHSTQARTLCQNPA